MIAVYVQNLIEAEMWVAHMRTLRIVAKDFFGLILFLFVISNSFKFLLNFKSS